VVLSKLWQGSLDEAEEACRRHDELGDSISMRHMVGASDLLIAQGGPTRLSSASARPNLNASMTPRPRDRARRARSALRRVARTDEALDEYHRASETAERAGINNEILVRGDHLLPGPRVTGTLGRGEGLGEQSPQRGPSLRRTSQPGHGASRDAASTQTSAIASSGSSSR